LATMAALHAIGGDLDKVIMTSMCCGYGKMDIDESVRQTINGCEEFGAMYADQPK
jgi:hypothetical protein